MPEESVLEKTGHDYGVRILGYNKVLFVGPHSADEYEAGVNELIAQVCTATGSNAIVNTQIERHNVDCNNRQSIIHGGNSVAKRFLFDLEAMVSGLVQVYGNTVVLFIHFSPRVYTRKRYLYERNEQGELLCKKAGEERDFDVDIGCGLSEFGKLREQRLVEASKIIPSRGSGKMTCSQSLVWQMKFSFGTMDGDVLLDENGQLMTRKNLVQYLAREYPEVCVAQLEIVNDVAEEKDLLQALTMLVHQLCK